MAKKDKNKTDNFNNPFSLLKGLPVSNPKKKAPEHAKAPETADLKPAQAVLTTSLDDDEQFAQAMGQLGVQQNDQDDVLERSVPVNRDQDVFVEVTDEPDVSQPQGSSRRQLRRVAKNMGEPEATLDLHGVTASEVIRKVEWFLENAAFHGCRFVRIVTGKGSHSATGPVLRPLVEDYLSSGPGRRFVVAWVKAPGNRGGDGALLVELQLPEDPV